MLEQLKLESLAKLDEGRLAEAFNAALRIISNDLDDRAGVDKKRKLTLTFTFEPIMRGNDLDEVNVAAEIASNVPKVGTPRPIAMKPRKTKDGMSLIFNDECSENPNQTTIGDHLRGDRPSQAS